MIIACVFSSLWFYYPLIITDCDINANVADLGYFENLAGTDKDLNHILSTFDDADHEIVNFCSSRYITFSDTTSIFQNSHSQFITLSLNVQSIHAKFNQLYRIANKLSSMGLCFGVIQKAEYAKFEQIITTAYEKHFPEKRVKFNKHEHKLSDWFTSGIWKSIEFRDILYRRLNKLSMDYLTQRLQYVEFDGTASSTRVIETGVPQGSILGPLLFIIWTIFIK